jgi:hypothetical protein
MGSSGSKRSNDPEYLKNLLQSAINTLQKYQDEKNQIISKMKKEIEEYLKTKNLNS